MVGSVPDILNTYSQEGLLAERQSPHRRVNAVAPTSISALEAMAEAGFACCCNQSETAQGSRRTGSCGRATSNSAPSARCLIEPPGQRYPLRADPLLPPSQEHRYILAKFLEHDGSASLVVSPSQFRYYTSSVRRILKDEPLGARVES
jgi:hypothetical protein